jgi:hypothetical protein
METVEYKQLFKNAKWTYPKMDEYFIQVACLKYLNDQNLICNDNIDNKDEIQESSSA